MKMRTPIGFFVAWLMLATPLPGAEFRNFYSNSTVSSQLPEPVPGPVPDGAEVFLRFPDGPDFLLGDVVEIEFVVANQGEVPFTYAYSGHFTVPGFPSTFEMTVYDENEAELPLEPKPINHTQFGLPTARELAPGEEISQVIRLQDHVRLALPGTYIVQISSDLGWVAEPDRPLPVAEAAITMTPPTPEQAEGRVRDLLAGDTVTSPPDPLPAILPDGTLNPLEPLLSMTTRTPFRYLNHPAYLPALEQAAAEGHLYALEGIHRIETIEATQAFLRLVESDEAQVANAAALFLSQRMPPLPYGPPIGNSVRTPSAGVVQLDQLPLLSRVWLPEASEPLRQAAAQMLQSENLQYRQYGALILSFIGTPADGAVLLEALKPYVEYQPPGPIPLDFNADAWGFDYTILRTLEDLQDRGYQLPDSEDLEVVTARMFAWADAAFARPEDWEEFLLEHFDLSQPVVGEASVGALPRRPTGRWADLLSDALESENDRIRYAAVRRAGYSENLQFIEPLSRMMREEQSWQHISTFQFALNALAGPLVAAEGYIEKLGVDNLNSYATNFLIGLIEKPPGYTGSRSSRVPAAEVAEVHDSWREFLSDPDRRALITQRQPVPVTEEEARALFGTWFQFNTADGPWPAPISD